VVRDVLAEKAVRALAELTTDQMPEVEYRCVRCRNDVRYCPPDHPCQHGLELDATGIAELVDQYE